MSALALILAASASSTTPWVQMEPNAPIELMHFACFAKLSSDKPYHLMVERNAQTDRLYLGFKTASEEYGYSISNGTRRIERSDSDDITLYRIYYEGSSDGKSNRATLILKFDKTRKYMVDADITFDEAGDHLARNCVRMPNPLRSPQ